MTWGSEGHLLQNKHANPFCAILARSSKICGPCLGVQANATKSNGSDTRTLRCFAGFLDSSVPVKWNNQVIGFLRTGQVLLRAPSVKQFRKIKIKLIHSGIKLIWLGLRRRISAPA